MVYFRPKANGKRLNIKQISKDLTKRFSSVTDIVPVSTSKLRVSVGDRKQANEIASYELFTLEYHVYLPSNEVEIRGVITEGSMTCDEIKQGCGRFKNRFLPSVQILDCKQMHSVSHEGEKKVYSLSDSFCVTFSGSALPDYVMIDKLRLPVRLYVPKVMECANCKQLGHTAQYCCNKPRCATCGERHTDGACKTLPKCVYCNGSPPHVIDDCPTYKQHRDHQRRSLQQRSRRSFSDMLKKATSSVESPNVFSTLPLDDQDSDSEIGDGAPFVFKGSTRKRMRASRPTAKHRKPPTSNPQQDMTSSNTDENVQNRSTPGFKPKEDRDFPPLPRSKSKIPNAPLFQFPQPERQYVDRQEQPQSSQMFTLSGIVDTILDYFNASDLIRNIVKGILPCVTPLLKQLASNLPLLATVISFDG